MAARKPTPASTTTVVTTTSADKKKEELELAAAAAADDDDEEEDEDEDLDDEDEEEEDDEEEAQASNGSPETAAAKKKTRKSSGIRERFFMALVMHKNKPAMQRIEAWEERDGKRVSITEAQVRAKCETLYGMKPLQLEGPFHPYKGIAIATRQIVRVDVRSAARVSTTLFECIYNDWRCIANGVLGCTDATGRVWKDDELLTLRPFEAVNPDSSKGKPLHRPRFQPNELVPKSEVVDLKPMQG